MGITPAIIGATASVAGAANNIFNSPSTTGGAGGSTPNVYVPPSGDLATQNTNLQGYLSGITGNNPWTNGGQQQYSGYLQNLLNSPQAGGYQNLANTAGSTAGNYADLASQQGAWLGQQGNSTLGLANYYSNLANGNPFAQQAQSGVNQAANYYSNAGQGQILGTQNLNPTAQTLNQTNLANASGLMPAAYSNYGQLSGLAGQLGAAGSQVLNTAFDPQSALYNQQYQQNQDATNANLAQAGLAGSGTAVGIQNQSDQNFNTNWENQQLGRQTQGLAADSAAAGQAGSLLGSGLGGLQSSATTAGNLGSQGLSGLTNTASATQQIQDTGLQNMLTGAQLPAQQYYQNLLSGLGVAGGAAGLAGQAAQTYGQEGALGNAATQGYLTAGQLPYQTQQSIVGNQLSGLQNYQNAYNTGTAPTQADISNILQYMGYGSNAGANLASAAQGSWQQGNLANQQTMQGLAGLGNQFSNIFGGTGSTTGGSGFDYGAAATAGYTPPSVDLLQYLPNFDIG